MSPLVLSDADLAASELGRKRRAGVTVADVKADAVADLFADFATARADGRSDLMQLIRDHAYAIDPALVDELDGFDYPAAA
ncbi:MULTISPECIES: hypothetical protein [Streptomyces]|uniref:Uncharacterized protein n=1 Tax=Streptomyces dengpaensis TaxID=2049881 RepID=A0ABM6SZ87_9ACTN|nr:MULTISPECIES: hypothetical protein [Streptomyces]AVH59974.1 hypothetical protein C4B68_34045 [Streptomyces dengpaensis]PIB09611.1 hypothetical protein B1C81_10720 [Streptomyces sp. HG99]